MMRIVLDSRVLEARLQHLVAGGGRLALSIVNGLTRAGVERAQMLASVDSGELKMSIQSKPAAIVNGEAEGSWGTNSDHAPYNEYGTGAPGATGQVANNQPRDPRAAGFTYTLNTIQYRKGRTTKTGQVIPPKDVMINGWVYYDTVRQRFVHTLGQPAQPFMYPAYLHVQNQAGEIAAAAVRDELKGR